MKRLLGIRHIFLLFLPIMMIMCFFVPAAAFGIRKYFRDR